MQPDNIIPPLAGEPWQGGIHGLRRLKCLLCKYLHAADGINNWTVAAAIFACGLLLCTLSWPILLLMCSSLITALSLSMSDTPLSVPDPALCSSSSNLCLRRRVAAILGCRTHSETVQIKSDFVFRQPNFYQLVKYVLPHTCQLENMH